jgi:phage nucleotide-binding protein
MKPIGLQEDLEKNTKLKVLIYGKQGSGKTLVGKCTGRTLLLSLEKGHRTLANAKNKIDIMVPTSTDELRECYLYAMQNKDEYDTIIIDSITEVSNIILDELQKDDYYGDPKNSLKLWNEVAQIQIKILKSFRDIEGVNVVLIALEDSVEENYKTKYYPLLDGKKAQKFTPALYDLILRFEKIKEKDKKPIYICHTDKDRLDILEPEFEIDKDKHFMCKLFKDYIG